MLGPRGTRQGSRRLEAAGPSRRTLAEIPSPALVIGGITSVQFGSALAANIFAQVGPGGAVLLRLVFATAVLMCVWRPRPTTRTRQELLLAALFGLSLAAMNTALYQAIDRIPLGIGVTIEFVGPLALGIAGSRRAIDVVWVGLAVIGIVALTHGDAHGLDPTGVVLALAAGGAWAAYILLNARIGETFQDGAGLTLAMCFATVIALPAGVAQGGAHLLAPHDLLLGAVVGILSSAIPYSLELEALRRIRPSVFGVLMSLEPAMAALAGFLVLGQALSGREIGGIALVGIASLGASRAAQIAAKSP